MAWRTRAAGLGSDLVMVMDSSQRAVVGAAFAEERRLVRTRGSMRVVNLVVVVGVVGVLAVGKTRTFERGVEGVVGATFSSKIFFDFLDSVIAANGEALPFVRLRDLNALMSEGEEQVLVFTGLVAFKRTLKR